MQANPDRVPLPHQHLADGGVVVACLLQTLAHPKPSCRRTPKLSSGGGRVSYELQKAYRPPASAASLGSACLWPPSRSCIGIMADRVNPCRP